MLRRNNVDPRTGIVYVTKKKEPQRQKLVLPSRNLPPTTAEVLEFIPAVQDTDRNETMKHLIQPIEPIVEKDGFVFVAPDIGEEYSNEGYNKVPSQETEPPAVSPPVSSPPKRSKKTKRK